LGAWGCAWCRGELCVVVFGGVVVSGFSLGLRGVVWLSGGVLDLLLREWGALGPVYFCGVGVGYGCFCLGSFYWCSLFRELSVGVGSWVFEGLGGRTIGGIVQWWLS